MIKQINDFAKTMIKEDYDLILENLMSDLQKDIFTLFYVQKLSKNDIENKLNISRYKLDKNLEIIRAKILKLKKFDIQFKVNKTTEKRLRERCRLLGKSKEYEEFCVLAFIKGFTDKQISDRMFIEVDTAHKYRNMRKNELEQFKE